MKLKGIQSVPVGEQMVAPAFARWSMNRPYAGHPPGRIGASRLGKCSKVLEYQIKGTPPSNPMGESAYHSTAMGSAIHDAIQAELKANNPEGVSGIENERPWSLELDVDGMDEPMIVESDGDIYWYINDDDELVEIKSMQPFAFKMKVSKEGPDRGHLTQLAMGMHALGVEKGRLVYIATAELKGRDRIVTEPGEFDFRENRYHEWTVPYPAVEHLIDYEANRISKARSYIEQGRTVPRTIPGVTPPGAVIVGFNAAKKRGIWQEWGRPAEGEDPVMIDTGETWHCGWCSNLDDCMDEMQAEHQEEEE